MVVITYAGDNDDENDVDSCEEEQKEAQATKVNKYS